jgi:chromosomal replication initiator protein
VKPTIAFIQAATADHYGVGLDTMWRRTNLREFAHPRQVAMCLSRRLTDHSTTVIGWKFKRDHSTVVNAEHRVEERCVADPKVAEAMRAITLGLLL